VNWFLGGVIAPNAGAARARHTSKQRKPKDRVMAAMDYFNQEPVVHTWTHKLDKAA
jgi:hypothetical protein